MGISHYLAMTAEEITAAETLPQRLAYMACHFSLYGTGITGLPKTLPKKAMLILNDRIPFRSHDPRQIAKELAHAMEALHCDRLLLDFQRQDTPKDLGKLLADTLPCLIGIAEGFADGTQCAVFLPPVPPDKAPEEYLKPWAGREIWLEAEPETIRITVDGQGSRRQCSPEDGGPFPFTDETLCCRYRTEVFPDRAEFTLRRTEEEIRQLLDQAEGMGVTAAVSLYQQMKKLPVK